jgi:arginyl-tRNA synthetase
VIVEVLRKLKYNTEAENLHHLSYEHVGLPDEKFSGRKGTWVGFTTDELLAEAQTRVIEKIKTEVDEEEKKKIARMVGVAAIKFSFLRTGSEKRITFKWDDALNMEGDSGPYLQYAFVRTNGIFSKTNEKPGVDETVVLNEQEKKLIKKMAQFSDIAKRSSKERAPHHVAQYSLELAADFSSFYTSSPVLTAEDKKTTRNRLAIVQATGIVLKNSLYLLGIDCPERM